MQTVYFNGYPFLDPSVLPLNIDVGAKLDYLVGSTFWAILIMVLPSFRTMPERPSMPLHT